MAITLITGVSGFIGSHLAKSLLSQGKSVLGIDSFYSSDGTNLPQLNGFKNFQFLEHDVRYPLPVSDLRIDVIYNLACPASPVHYQKDPVMTINTCLLGAINVLELARRCGSRVLQASTSEVYGDPLQHPQSESYWGNVNPCGPRSCYDEGKRAAETLFHEYRAQYQVDTRTVRIFNTYGPNMAINDGRVVSQFICQALRNEPFQIYGTGHQTRSFCYVSDLVDGLIRTMNLIDSDGTPINLGNPEEVTILEIAQRIADFIKITPRYAFNPTPVNDPMRRNPNIAKAKNLLGWSPRIALHSGLPNTIEYFVNKILNEKKAA